MAFSRLLQQRTSDIKHFGKTYCEFDQLEGTRERTPQLQQHSYTPSIYRVVYKAIAFLEKPSTKAPVIELCLKGEIVRISEIVPPCWGRVDDDELWARFTQTLPTLPPGSGTPTGIGEDESLLVDAKEDKHTMDTTERDSIIKFGNLSFRRTAGKPEFAFALLHGADAESIEGDPPLLERIRDSETQMMEWRIRDVHTARALEKSLVARRLLEVNQRQLRQEFIERCLHYIGTPYSEDNMKEEIENKRKRRSTDLWHDTEGLLFLDCCGLVIQAVDDLKASFGFTLRGNQSYFFTILKDRRESHQDLVPGDLVFLSGHMEVSGKLLSTKDCSCGSVFGW
eukprot:gnl/MRDRNA2_/MRDRNA2_21374_c0_seq1.p1 gnl/MRDRNA2_/MRDRNA2_21374_c0~~gnl/MRDRNA2_/MRDRNA2_21374_c0_seq1.p1  ORF type:complete len:339 (-),score=71.29 gnl/MRDRNA2_/MRDRNA2_21374_c0_seq1:190-1206(-)